jgi:hypothetical protein
LVWVLAAIDMARGIRLLPWLSDAVPLVDAECPTVSILFGARDEAEKLEGALGTMLALEYPRYEVVAVDDRSEDGTRQILKAAAAKDARLKAVHVEELPAGWLGKPHALEKAYENSTGEWLIFTDADVHFAPDVLRRAVALARQKKWEHLTLLANVKMHSAGEKITLTYFAFSFLMGIRPWEANNPKSSVYAGVGAFQLIRREAYERIGTHRRLAMEVVDDMKLGKLCKQNGVASGIGRSGDAISVYWHAGVGNIVRGTTKNFFATMGFQPGIVAARVLALLVLSVMPWVTLPFVHGWARIFAGVAVGLAIAAQLGVTRDVKVSPLYALTHPIGALILAWMVVRSMVVTLWQGGIRWRGTFYPLEELKRGMV